MLRSALLACPLLAWAAVAALAFPAAAQTVAITNARVLTAGQAGEIQNGTVVIENGRIAAVGAGVAVPAGARVIDAQGRTVTPGIVSTGSDLGLNEVSAVGAQEDATGSAQRITAAFDVQYGLNPASTLFPVARLGGVTRAIVEPNRGGGGDGHAHDGSDTETQGVAGEGASSQGNSGLFAGQAAAIHTGQAPDVLVRPRVAMVLDLGERGAGRAGGARGSAIVELLGVLSDVRDFRANRAAFERAERREYGLSAADLEALIPVVEGRQPVIVRVRRASDIRQILRIAREQRLRIILEDVEEGWMVAPEIAAAGVPVLVNPISDLPGSFEALGATLENAARLHAAGVTVVIRGDRAGHYARQTRWLAGNAVAYGMPYAAALQAITANPARVFGLGEQFGTLEVGREADLVVWNGDPFEPITQPEHVFIRGVEQPLFTRQQQLRDRYRAERPLPPGYN